MGIHSNEFDHPNQETLRAIFEHPPRLDIAWADVVKLFKQLKEIVAASGGTAFVKENGDRIWVAVEQGTIQANAILHRPRGQRQVSRSTVQDIKDFLITLKVE